MLNPDHKYWVALSQFPKIGSLRFQRLMAAFPLMEMAWQASTYDLKQARIEGNVAEEIVQGRPAINPDQLIEQMDRENIKVVTLADDNYPPLLREIYDPPGLLYYRGTLPQDEYTLAVVGTRKISRYGEQITPPIVSGLSQAGLTIVSGLALGVDALAHNCTIDSQGRTIAVLGSGIDQASIYPSSNRYLAEKIVASGGAIVSEYPLGALPLKSHFPHRNRIISGLSLGTLVIEADIASGALITTKCALEQNRDVFAVPGSITNRFSDGPNHLIKMGAKAVTEAQDILDALNLNEVTSILETRSIVPDTQEEAKILSILNREPMHVDELVRHCQLDTKDVHSTLTMMEMKGKVRNLGGMHYVRSR